MAAIKKALEYVKTVDVKVARSKDVPAVIIAAGHTPVWKKSVAEWEVLMLDLETTLELHISRCNAFITATEMVPVVLYDLVHEGIIIQLCERVMAILK